MKYKPNLTRLAIQKTYVDYEPDIKEAIGRFDIAYGSNSGCELEVTDLVFIPEENADLDKLEWLLGNSPANSKIWDSKNQKLV